MSSQINFIISPECEYKLFAFIANECKCNIFLPESITGEFLFEKEGEITSDKYLISPLPGDFKFKTERRQGSSSLSEVWVIYPFDENKDFLPIIEYERDLFSDSADMPCRLYLRTSTVSPKFKSDMKILFRKIKKWIKDNSNKKIKMGLISLYEVKGE